MALYSKAVLIATSLATLSAGFYGVKMWVKRMGVSLEQQLKEKEKNLELLQKQNKSNLEGASSGNSTNREVNLQEKNQTHISSSSSTIERQQSSLKLTFPFGRVSSTDRKVFRNSNGWSLNNVGERRVFL